MPAAVAQMGDVALRAAEDRTAASWLFSSGTNRNGAMAARHLAIGLRIATVARQTGGGIPEVA